MENLKNGLRLCVVLALLGVIVLASCTMGNNEADARQVTPEENCQIAGGEEEVFSFGTLDREEFDRLVQYFVDYGFSEVGIIEHAASELRYIGTFNSTVVFRDRNRGGFGIIRIFIGGVEFTSSNGNFPIFVWTDGRIYPLIGIPAPPDVYWRIPDAYEKGLLTREDLQYIADAWHSIRLGNR